MDVRFLTVSALVAESGSRRSVRRRNDPQVPSLPPSDRRRRLGRRLRSSFSRHTRRERPARAPSRRRAIRPPRRRRGPGAVSPAVSESGAWNSPGTAGPASGCAARTPSSWPIPIHRSSGRRDAASPATSSPSATPTTTRCRKARGASRATAGPLLPTSLEDAFVLDGPGEYEVKRCPRDRACGPIATTRKGAERGRQTAFVIELDGVHTIHLGDIGHLLTEEKLGDIGSVDVACVPVGGALTRPAAAELVAQLDPRIVVPMPSATTRTRCDEALSKFLHEMGAAAGRPGRGCRSPRRAAAETTTVILEQRGAGKV